MIHTLERLFSSNGVDLDDWSFSTGTVLNKPTKGGHE